MAPLVATIRQSARVKRPESDDELKMARQALWDVYVALGFDPDGDNEWHCSTAAACKTAVSAAQEARTDYDEALAVTDLPRLPPGLTAEKLRLYAHRIENMRWQLGVFDLDDHMGVAELRGFADFLNTREQE